MLLVAVRRGAATDPAGEVTAPGAAAAGCRAAGGGGSPIRADPKMTSPDGVLALVRMIARD